MSALSELIANANSAGLTGREVRDRAASLGEKISADTAWRVLSGRHQGTPTEETLRALSAVFGVPLETLRAAANLPTEVLGPFEPPENANRLGRREREAVNDVIRVLVAARPGRAPFDSSTFTTPEKRQVTKLLDELGRRAREADEQGQPAMASVLVYLESVLAAALRPGQL